MQARLIRFWPWLAASAAIHGLLLIYWLTPELPPTSIHATDEVVLELMSMEPSAQKQIAAPTIPSLSEQEKQHATAQQQIIAKATLFRPPVQHSHATLMAQKKPKKKVSIITQAKAQTVAATKQPTSTLITTTEPKPALSVSQYSTRRPASHPASMDRKKTSVLVRKHLEAFKYYPASARRRGIEGHVEVGFTLTRHGAADQVAVLHGSGYAVLDHAALETVYRAQPFPVEDGTFRFSLRFKRL